MAERLAVAGLAAVLGVCGGCTDQTKLREAELTQLLDWLPGSYDNGAQLVAQPGLQPAHERIALVIVRVYAPRLGHHSLYAQEMAADDPRRVMSEKILSFAVDPKRGIVETVYSFNEPLRWRDGQHNIELFTGVMPQDVHNTGGCELLWKKSDERFSAAPDTAHCHPVGPVAPIERAALLTADTLTLGGYEFRKTGQ